MKQLLLISILFITMIGFAQEKKVYVTSGGEMIFSFAAIDNGGSTDGSVMRWSPVFNLQTYGNYDFSKHAGLIFGGALRNVGFIYDNPTTGEKKKYRNYNIGIPVGIKVGNLNKVFFFGGYEIEFPINYKEKTFVDEKKTDKFNVWFSSRVPSYYHSVFAGIQFPYGLNLKFKYYLSEFFNQNYTESSGNQPYKGLKANVFYFSISTSLFKGHDIYMKEYKREMQSY